MSETINDMLHNIGQRFNYGQWLSRNCSKVEHKSQSHTQSDK